MATHLTEEEQIEAFKRWWSENWVTIVLPLIVGVLIYVAWFWWQDHKEAKAELASDQYDAIIEILEQAESTETGLLSAEQKQQVITDAEALISAHGKTLYADHAHLILGGLYAEESEFDKAANHINRVVQSGANDGISLLARARLAKVYMAQDRLDEALSLISGQTSDDSYTSIFAEIRGDIFVAKGDMASANSAYKLALEKLSAEGLARSGLLQTKISATNVSVVESSPIAAGETTESGNADESEEGSAGAAEETPVAQSSEAAGETK